MLEPSANQRSAASGCRSLAHSQYHRETRLKAPSRKAATVESLETDRPDDYVPAEEQKAPALTCRTISTGAPGRRHLLPVCSADTSSNSSLGIHCRRWPPKCG